MSGAPAILPSNPLQDGTYHQNALGLKKNKLALFSPLNPDYADAVHQDAVNVVFSKEEERAVRRKIDSRVLPMIFCSFIFNGFNRSSIGNAHIIFSFNQTYGIESNQKWTLALSIFYVGYCLLGMPANVFQRYIGANRFFFLTITFWGIASLSFVYAKGYPGLIVLRLLLGIGEAGFHAGTTYYLSFWYKRHELAIRISLTLSTAVAGALGGILAFGLVQVNTPLLTGWQLLFLVEAIPTLLTAITILLFLPAYPFTANFLSPREKAIAQARVDRDHKPQSHGGMTGWQGFKCVVGDPHAWMFMLIYASFNMGPASIIYILPTLIDNLGFSSIEAQGLTVAPYVFAYFLVFALARHSDYKQERGWHVMTASLLSTVGYVVLAIAPGRNTAVAYSALFLVVGGVFSLVPLVLSWAANTFSPTSKRGVGTAFIISVANCLSIMAPQIYFDPEDGFRKGHAICAGCLFFSFCITFILRTRLVLLNRRNPKDVPAPAGGAGVGEDGSGEIWDTDMRYVFTT